MEHLKKEEIGEFWETFSLVLTEDFPRYGKNVIRYLLEKIYTKTNFYYWLINNLKTVLAAKSQNEIIGFAVIDEPYGGVSLCRWLGVKKEFRHQGIGSRLINSWIKLAQSQGCHKIEIASQPEAKGFYEKIGLKLEGERKLSYFGVDQFIFGKIIGSPNEKAMVK